MLHHHRVALAVLRILLCWPIYYCWCIHLVPFMSSSEWKNPSSLYSRTNVLVCFMLDKRSVRPDKLRHSWLLSWGFRSWDYCLSALLMRAPSMTNPSRIWSSFTGVVLMVFPSSVLSQTLSQLSMFSLPFFSSPFLLWWHRGENERPQPWRTQVEMRTNYWKQQWDKKTNRRTKVYERVIYMQRCSAHPANPGQGTIWDGSPPLPHLFDQKEHSWKGERDSLSANPGKDMRWYRITLGS